VTPGATPSALAPATAELLQLAHAGQARPGIDFVLGLLAGGAPVDQLVEGVLAPVQREVGRRWEANEWSVADEHAATAVVDGALGALALQTPVAVPPLADVLLACAEGEHHTLPARMGAELLRSIGCDVTFLGGSLPAHDLQRHAAATLPDIVVVSCTVDLHLSASRRSFDAIDDLGMPCIGAGAAFGLDDRRARHLGASGWLGPKPGRRDVLRCLEVREPLAFPTPAEATALELDAEGLQRSCMSELADRLPQLATCSEAQLTSTRTDVGYIIAYLATAIDVGDDAIFRTFVRWLLVVLGSRGVPPVVLARSLEIIGAVLAIEGHTEAARLCAAEVP
jgi:methanogenic corrinoid protein MtbC1